MKHNKIKYLHSQMWAHISVQQWMKWLIEMGCSKWSLAGQISGDMLYKQRNM